MTDRPIIFSAPMVRALLEGRKTQTRRLLSFQPGEGFEISHYYDAPLGVPQVSFVRGSDGFYSSGPIRFEEGDRLYVREAFAPLRRSEDVAIKDAEYAMMVDGHHQHRSGRATPGLDQYADGAFDGIKWRPSIHMPRWASRITLFVDDVRVQRLGEITDADAIAEGLTYGPSVECSDGASRALWFGVPQCGYEDKPGAPRQAYFDLWDSLHNPRGLCAEDEPRGAAADPWVVAVTFRVERGNIDRIAA